MLKYGVVLLVVFGGFISLALAQNLAPYEVIEEVRIAPSNTEAVVITSDQPISTQSSAPMPTTPTSAPIAPSEVYGGKAAQLEEKVNELSTQLTAILDKMERMEHQQEITAKSLEVTLKSIEGIQKKLESTPKHHEKSKHKESSPKILEPKDIAPEEAAENKDEDDEVVPEETSELSASEEYQKARALISTGKYGAAETALLAFIKKYPDNDLASSAKYWLGETYFVQKKYTKAAATFADGYKTAPKGIKAPDNLLKLAMSLKELNKSKEACTTVKELLKHKTAPDALSRKAQNLKKQLPGCK